MWQNVAECPAARHGQPDQARRPKRARVGDLHTFTVILSRIDAIPTK
ncbi:MAG: hypothetical protein JNJ90_20340 [Saprospiraceae bacterium]|nr:hypothetical protein [Saprospiraceae bacterium]